MLSAAISYRIKRHYNFVMPLDLPEGLRIGGPVEILWAADEDGTVLSDRYYECKVVRISGSVMDVLYDEPGANVEPITIDLTTSKDNFERDIEDLRLPPRLRKDA
jgi:hypothetical protein